MQYDVFISYGSHDRNVADSLCTYLEQQHLRCWMAPRNISSGSNYAGEITRALRSSESIIVICSRESSQSGHVKNEVTLAFNQNKRILPYCLDDNPFDDDLEYYLSSKQQIRTCGNRIKDFEQIYSILGERLINKDGDVNDELPKENKPIQHKRIIYFIFSLILLSIIVFISFYHKNEDIDSYVDNHQTISVQTLDTFTGNIIDGQPDGYGTYTFAQPRLIDYHDSEKREADIGDYITGDWKNGHLNFGEWYDSCGVLKGFIQLGDYLDVETDWKLGICEKP